MSFQHNKYILLITFSTLYQFTLAIGNYIKTFYKDIMRYHKISWANGLEIILRLRGYWSQYPWYLIMVSHPFCATIVLRGNCYWAVTHVRPCLVCLLSSTRSLVYTEFILVRMCRNLLGYRNTPESVPGTNQYWAVSVKVLAQGNNRFPWQGLNPCG